MTKPLQFTKILLIAILLIMTGGMQSQIMTNGDFESGGSGIGFLVHDYTVINPPNGTGTPGFYTRTTDPFLMNSTYISGGDHTTGTGNMLVFDGSLLSNRFFWTTGNTGGAIGGFTAGTTYTFSFWIKSVSNEVADDETRASIGIFFVNANNINPVNQNFLAPLPADGWINVQYSFVATADNVMVRLKTNNPGPVGHDFAVDDFSITEGGLEFEGSYAFVNPTCPGGNDGSITVTITGGTLPYSAYTLTGSANQSNNNGIFAGLGEGTYNVTVSDATGEQFTQTGIVLSAPNTLEISEPTTICSGQSTQLSATGGTGSYSWTANPPDASLTDTTGATPTVSPTVTTTYTVTSGSVSSDVNLIENGDFEQGNTLFVTEYTQVPDPNPFGVQSAYDIVTNPNAWFTAFASCGDHTSGSGNLMVFDGAVDPTGNVIAWSNQNPVNVIPNTDYTFSYYVASVAPENPARLEVMINGVSQGQPVTAPGATCLWTQVSYNWNSGANTTADFVIYDRNTASGGNDFALDDISFKETTTCLYQQSVTITVTPATVPTFNPVGAICAGDPITPLATTSLNGITGSWSPAPDNTTTTIYTFLPDSGQCASTTTMTITVHQPTTPTFASVAPICQGEILNPLPTTSLEGIPGTWSPALDNTETTTYTFTPSGGQCIGTTTLTVIVNPAAVPTFNQVATICAGQELEPLPTTSLEGISGSWSPALDNTATTTYTFTPGVECATPATLTVTVNEAPEFSISEGCNGVNYTLGAVQDDASDSTYEWFGPSGEQIGTNSFVVIDSPGLYELVVTQNGCSNSETLNVLSTACKIQKGISANNDGQNDYFDLEGFNVSQLKIFNRYGIAVYSKAGYRNQWYGQSDNGDELPDGTYYYLIDFEDRKSTTGWIYINRMQ